MNFGGERVQMPTSEVPLTPPNSTLKLAAMVLIVAALIGLVGIIIVAFIVNSESSTLLGDIDEVVITPDEHGGAQVFIYMSIRNMGDLTRVSQYTIQIDNSASKDIEFNGQPAEISKPYTIPQTVGGEAVVIRPQDSIVSRTEQGIAKDQKVSGWLRVGLPEAQGVPEMLRQPGIWYTVSFADAAGTIHKASYEIK